MKRWLGIACVLVAACTDVSTDPNAVVALRFQGAAYPSIVIGDSLRDSLGVLQVLQAVGLNFRGDAVAGAPFEFSSPDTSLRLFSDGVVFARTPNANANPALVFARTGSLQSQPDSLRVVARGDSIKALKDADTILFDPGSNGASAPNAAYAQVFGDTAVGKPKVLVPSWLVSFQLRYRGALISPSDTSLAFTFELNSALTKRFQTIVDTTDPSGNAGHRIFVRSLAADVAEDTIFLVSTIRQRKANTDPISVETMILLRHK